MIAVIVPCSGSRSIENRSLSDQTLKSLSSTPASKSTVTDDDDDDDDDGTVADDDDDSGTVADDDGTVADDDSGTVTDDDDSGTVAAADATAATAGAATATVADDDDDDRTLRVTSENMGSGVTMNLKTSLTLLSNMKESAWPHRGVIFFNSSPSALTDID